MKKSIVLLALIISCFTAAAQNKQSLEKNAIAMYNNTVNGNYEELIGETYPKIFEIVPKEKMLESLKGMLNGEGYVMDIVDTPPNFEYGPIKKIGEGYYCIINHDLLMKMTFKEPISAAESQAMIDNFKKAMKTEDVVFNPKYNSFTMKKRADVIAISDKLTNNQWMFLNRTGSALMAKIFTEDVRKEMGL